MDKYYVSMSIFKVQGDTKDDHPTHVEDYIYADSKEEAIEKARRNYQYRDMWVKITGVHKVNV